MTLISIVIPVYKSSKSLEVLAEQIDKLARERDETFDIVFVNDSPEFPETVKTLEVIADRHSRVKVITLRKNQGQHIALLVGVSQAEGDYVITMDDDLQHPVSEIPKLIKAIHENPEAEAVFAVPFYANKKHSAWRNLGSFVLNKVDTLSLKKPKGLVKSPFRMFTADLAMLVANNYNAMPALSSLIINASNNIINVEVAHNNRTYGRSNYSLRKLISLSLNNILHYSSLPLKMVGFIGLTGFLFSVLFIVYTLAKKIFWGIAFPGYASTATLISLFGGLNLLALGLIGEYLIRIIKEQQKPDLKDLIKE